MGFSDVSVDEKTLFTSVREKHSESNSLLIRKAFEFASKAHEGQTRLSGEPYIVHPINVAYILTELGLDSEAVCAGLLHDVVEDTKFTTSDIGNAFGQGISSLVEGVTKISALKNQSKETKNAENIRKMLVATVRDIRVILIKLADKTHNMRTLKFQSPEKRVHIAQETIYLYAPIAGRLGIYKIKSELEDLAFQILHPDEYQLMKKNISTKKSERTEYIEKIKIILKQRLSDINIQATIEGRAKHFYSIYRKMKAKDRDINEIFDLRGIRIITDEIRDCYGVLGIVHTLWTPVPGRFKDYIATPKTNLYQSLHTTVIGPDGKPMEVQIRTMGMNNTAEYGIAAHWAYKEKGVQPTDDSRLTPKWIERLRIWDESTEDPTEFLEDLAAELHEDEVFVFTPKGKIIDLPKGSTVLDYAFRIHTDIGIHARGAKSGGRMIPLRTVLRSGEQIEIITDKKTSPSPIWLRFVKTSSARQKIRQYLRKIQDEPFSETEKSSPGSEMDLLSDQELALLKKNKGKRKRDQKQKVAVIVAGIRDILVRLSGCCSPVPGDKILGFITRGRGVTVHKLGCPSIGKQPEDSRMVAVRWEGMYDPVPAKIEVKAHDKQGIYLEMVKSISFTDTNILEAGANSMQGGTLEAHFLIEVEHLDQLEEILENLRNIKGIISAVRKSS